MVSGARYDRNEYRDIEDTIRGLILVAEQAMERGIMSRQSSHPSFTFSDRIDLHDAIKSGKNTLAMIRLKGGDMPEKEKERFFKLPGMLRKIDALDEVFNKPLETDYDALVMALVLGITAPSEEDAIAVSAQAELVARSLTLEEVMRAKLEALLICGLDHEEEE